MTEFTLLDGNDKEIAREVAGTKEEALLVFGKRTDVSGRLELCDNFSEAKFRLKWLNPVTEFPAEFEFASVRYKR
jgi:hypothetical protein